MVTPSGVALCIVAGFQVSVTFLFRFTHRPRHQSNTSGDILSLGSAPACR